jgi:hypothetical protein
MDRNNILGEILDIESQIRIINVDPAYLAIQRNYNNLEEKRFGSNVVSIASPDDLSIKLVTRRRSPEFKDIVLRYRERLTEFEEQVDELYSRREKLVKQLFPTES